MFIPKNNNDCSLTNKYLEKMDYTSRLSVNLKNIQHNYTVLKSYAQEKNKHTITGAVIKADAYGLGMIEVSKALLEVGCKCFFVSTLDEGIKFRSAIDDPKIKIYLLNGCLLENLEICKELSITPVCHDIKQIIVCKNLDLCFAVQIETGLRRLGITPEELIDAEKTDSSLLNNCCLMLSQYVDSANYRSELCQKQYSIIMDMKNKYPNIMMSIANSGGLNWGSDHLMDLVRIGRALYGTCHSKFEYADKIKSVLTWQVQVLQTQTVPQDCSVGYDQLYRTKQETKIATIDAGYYEGIPINACDLGMFALYYEREYSYSNDEIKESEQSLSKNLTLEQPKKILKKLPQKLPFIGRTSMDLAVVDISSAPEIQAGDWINILDEFQTLDSLADEIGANPRQLLLFISRNANKDYFDK